MKWFAGAILLLIIAILFGLDLLAYAMYVLLAVMIVSRFLTRNWAQSTRNWRGFPARREGSRSG